VNNSQPKPINIHPFLLTAPGLSASRAGFMGECAAACLEINNHASGVRLAVEGCSTSEFALEWRALTKQQTASCGDLQEATEHGAYGVAILVVKELTGKNIVERSAKGTGFDWWMGERESDLPFQNCTRLEVSGILEGGPSEIASRMKIKRKQVSPTDGLGTAHIAVIEFGRPVVRVESK